MKSKRIITMFLIAVLLIGSIPATAFADKPKFKDVEANYWASEFIQVLVNNGILSGYGNGNFAPEKGITREEFAVVLFKTFGLDETKPTVPSFKDVDSTRWSYGYIEAAKPFLTGYFPPNGKPTFDPEGQATREDVAVALVRALNLDTLDKTIDDDYLRFRDASDISPNLREEVSLAIEHKLISGFPNNTLQPAASITRAQASAMIYKVIKSTFSKFNVVYSTTINMPTQVSSNLVPISVTLPAGSKLIINDILTSYSGTVYNGNWKINNGPGTYTYNFSVQYPNGKIETFTKQVVFTASAPEIKFIGTPAEKVNQAKYTFKFSVTDISNSKITGVTVNGLTVDKGYWNDYYTANLILKEGGNDIVIEAKNSLGLTSVKSFKVIYESNAPVITFVNIPSSSVNPQINIDLKVTDKYNQYLTLYVNNVKYTVTNDQIKTIPYTLVRGENTLVFKAVNSQEKITTVTRTIVHQSAAPTVRLVSGSAVHFSNVTVEFRVADLLYKPQYLSIKINGVPSLINTDGSVLVPLTLKEGQNLINVELTNPDGITTKAQFFVDYNVLVPELVTDWNALSKLEKVEWNVTAKDPYGKDLQFTLNGKAVAAVPTAPGVYAFKIPQTLTVGNNPFVLIAKSSIGVETKLEKSVLFSPEAPVLNISEVPATTDKASLTLSGTIADLNDPAAVLRINDTLIAVTSGAFNHTLTLIPGDQSIVIKSTNRFGLTTEISKVIRYTPPVVQPK